MICSLVSGPFDGGGGLITRRIYGTDKSHYKSLPKRLSLILIKSIILISITSLAYIASATPEINSFVGHNHLSAATGLSQRHSGHYSLAELCPRNRAIPAWKKIDGAVISLNGPSSLMTSGFEQTSLSTTSFNNNNQNFNCNVSLQTRNPQQHFKVRFEDLRLACSDHLRLFDGDIIYGQASIKDYSCRDNMANVQPLQTTGTFLTLSYYSSSSIYTSSSTKSSSANNNINYNNNFRFVVTAVYDNNMAPEECPLEASLCLNRLCISKWLFCDGTNHCLDNSDELNCARNQLSNNNPNGQRSPIGFLSAAGDWLFGSSESSMDSSNIKQTTTPGDANLSNALMLLVVLVLIIFVCVIIFISAIYCRRNELIAGQPFNPHQNHHVAYQLASQQQQHPLAGPLEGFPLQGSSSVMFTNPAAFVGHQQQQQHQPYPHHAHHLFQPPNTQFTSATLDTRRRNHNQHWIEHQQQNPIHATTRFIPATFHMPGASQLQQQLAFQATPLRVVQPISITTTSQPNGVVTTLPTNQAQQQQANNAKTNNSNNPNSNNGNMATSQQAPF